MAVRISAIIPAYNEADVIRNTIRAALSIDGVSQLIVVDDGSFDGTGEAARTAGAHEVVILGHNVGKGGALNAAWPHVTGDILLLLDADLGQSASEGGKLLDPLIRDEADMAVALFGRSEPVNGGSAKLSVRSKGFGTVVKTARLGIRLLTGRWVDAPLAGPRAVRREIIEKAGGFATKFGVEVGLTIDALRLGYSIVEVPVGMVHRASGRDFKGFMHRGKQMADMLRTLTRKALRI